MTDIYKKLYGYEDDIQLKDNDIKTLEDGMVLRKMSSSKDAFNDRLYRLDLNNNQLVANTKEFRKKEKIYPLVCLNEVKSGCSSDDLKAYKLKKSISDKKRADELENHAFVIVYENYKKTLDLLAPNEIERDRWVRVLSYFILLTKKRKGVLPETDKIMRNYFKLADTSNDKKISESELSAFLDSINIKLKKDQLKKMINESDINNDGILDEDEFDILIHQLYTRKEIIRLFKLIETQDSHSTINYIPQYVTLEKFKKFLEVYQQETKSDEECIKMIQKYEPNDDCKEENKLTLHGFMNYLNDHDQFIDNHEHDDHVYQNMNLTFKDYFINSSHNTYLTGDQLTSSSLPEGYVSAIMKGARLLELDCYDGSDGQPRIYHKKTLTTKILFEDVLMAIKDYAFKLTEYPLILTIELHCSPPQQTTMAFLINKHLGEYLLHDFDKMTSYPTLNQLKNKILLRCRKPKEGNADGATNGSNSFSSIKELIRDVSLTKVLEPVNSNTIENDQESEYEDSKRRNILPLKDLDPELREFINVLQNASFKGIDHAYQNYFNYHTSSLSEIKANKLIESEDPCRIINYNINYLTKVYPAYFRTDSSNFNPIDYWIYGFQIAALNFQTNDTPMKLNKALFHDNGGCGYVLKPEILRNPLLGFNPLDTSTMKNKMVFEIKVISAQKLPRQTNDIVDDISDPYVKISIHGVPSDCCEQKTRPLKDNGFNPFWNEDFKFLINCPELAIVKFTVYDEDIGKDQSLGYYTIRFQSIRQGYRHVRLINMDSKGTLFVGIKIYPHIE